MAKRMNQMVQLAKSNWWSCETVVASADDVFDPSDCSSDVRLPGFHSTMRFSHDWTNTVHDTLDTQTWHQHLYHLPTFPACQETNVPLSDCISSDHSPSITSQTTSVTSSNWMSANEPTSSASQWSNGLIRLLSTILWSHDQTCWWRPSTFSWWQCGYPAERNGSGSMRCHEHHHKMQCADYGTDTAATTISS